MHEFSRHAVKLLQTQRLAHRLPSLPAEHRRKRSWPTRMTAARARSGRGWPACVTSTPKPANRQRMFPGWDPSSSPSNRRLWCARERAGVPLESLPLNIDLTPAPDAPRITLYSDSSHYYTYNMRKYCYCKFVTPTSCYLILGQLSCMQLPIFSCFFFFLHFWSVSSN